MQQKNHQKYFTNSLMGLVVGGAVAKTISGVMINHVIEHFGLTGAAQGYMNSAINIGITTAVLSTFVFRWKYGKAPMLVLSGAMAASMMALTGLSVSFYMLLAVSFVLGVGLGWTDTYSNSCVIDANPSGSAKNQSAMQGWYGVGAIITPLAVTALLSRGNWQAAYLALTPAVFLAVIAYAVVLRTAGRHISLSAMETRKISAAEARQFFSDRKSIWLLAACFSYYVMQYGLFAWLVRYMNVRYGEEALGMAGITMMWACTTVCRFIAPRLPVNNMKLHAFGALVAGLTLLIGIFSGNPWTMCVMVGVGALATGNSLPTLMNRAVVNHQGGSLLPTSAMLLVMQITGMALPPVLGWISDYSMQASMVVLVAGVLASGAFAFVVLRLMKKEKPVAAG